MLSRVQEFKIAISFWIQTLALDGVKLFFFEKSCSHLSMLKTKSPQQRIVVLSFQTLQTKRESEREKIKTETN